MNTFSHISTLLIVCFTAALFWCGDAECMSGTDEDGCASLVCSLLCGGASPKDGESDGGTKDCSCVCHVPSVVPPPMNPLSLQVADENWFEPFLLIPSISLRPVYRPPILA